MLKYERDGEAIVWRREVTTQALVLRAERVSEERTGIHARLVISLQSTAFSANSVPLLGWSYLNVERAEERTRLANAAHGAIPNAEFAAIYAKEELRKDLDLFCLGLWDFETSRFLPEEMEGDTDNTAPEFLLRPYLLKDGGTILYAPPGRAKSLTALLWAVSVDAGNKRFWPVEQTPVLYINLERSRRSLARRLSRVNFVLDEVLDRPLSILNARGKSLRDVEAGCRKFIFQHKTGLAILDSLSRAGMGDLNENQPVNRIIDVLNGLCPSWCALGHTSRASEGHLFGSVMADAGADLMVELSSQLQGETLGVGWEVVKANDTPPVPMSIYRLGFDEGGLTSFARAKAGEFPDIEGKSPQHMPEAIQEFVLESEGAEATATQIAEKLGFNRGNVSAYLKNSPLYYSRREGNNVFYRLKDFHAPP